MIKSEREIENISGKVVGALKYIQTIEVGHLGWQIWYSQENYI